MPRRGSSRSKPRELREARQSNNYHIYLLHCLRLFIYLVGHALIVVGALVSKLSVLILATNLSNQPPPPQSVFHRTCSIVVPPKRNFHENEFTLFAALYLIQTLPDLFAIFQSGYHLLRSPKYDLSVNKSIIFFETLRTAGLSCLFFFLFPDLELTRCVLLLCGTAFMPYFAKVVDRFLRSLDYSQRLLRRLGILFGNLPRTLLLSILLSSMYLWSAMNVPFERIYILPAAMLMFGVGNWETWIKPHHAGGRFNRLFQFKYGLRKISTFNRIVTSVFRISAVSFVASWSMFDRKMYTTDFVQLVFQGSIAPENIRILILAFFVICANFFIRCCARFLAAMRMRMLNILHPGVLLTPLLFIFFYLTAQNFPLCMINTLLRPLGLNWQCYRWHLIIEPCSDYYVTLVWLVCYIFWSYKYVKGRRYGKMDEVIESMPIALNGLAVENCLVIFRYVVGKKEIIEDLDDEPYADEHRIVNSEIDRTMTLYVCATMWHETRNEMVQMLKSILKLDEEHAIRLAEKSRDTIRFRLEVHIYFDDAWLNNKECGRIPNSYFELLFELLTELTSNVDTPTSDSRTRVIANTSFGGRLVVRLPAGTLLFVHLKDKILIRHKKRWSQVMYMYYLLGHRIMDSHLSVEDQQLQADNTYILAVDGDSKFEPEAVVKLLHLMNKKSDIGYACGRIHPIGDGIMVWYQKFEYAIAHWFQKAAEHVFGCVLCAPGCFSFFRASAIMDDNIMHKYTKTAEEPRHYVQYDQGEDRLLSTLMFKQGYRIEYAAGADAETYAPEGFEEFYNQRRRWTPSSVANTLDLLADYKLASQNNASISMVYIMYQMFVISFSLLGPAIIFTMLVYAQVAAFCMNSTHVLVYNAVPVCFFIFCCFCMDSSVQLFFAKVASIVYAFLMLAVMIATAQQIVLETIFSLMSIFVLMLIVIFMFAALVHPKEFKNILFGAIYFLIIPSAYVFLSLYSLVNLNVINRGTREAVVKATGDKTNSDKLGEKWVKRLGLDNEKSVAFKLMPWLTPKVPEDNESLGALERKVERPEALQKSMDIGQNGYSAQPQDAFSRLHIISHEQRQKGLANKYEATPARTLENVHAPHVAFRVRWIIFIVIMCITFDNASATPLEATKEKTPKSLADLTALAIGTVVTYFGLSESLWNWWPVTDCIIFTMSLVVAAVRMMENAYSASEGFECIVLWHSLACGCWCMIEFLNSQRTRQIDVNMNPARASPSMMYRNSVSFVPSMVFFFCEVYDNGISLRLLAILVPLMVLLTVVLGFSFFTCQEPARNAAAQDAMPPPPVAIPPLFSSLSTHRFGDSNDFRSFDQALPSPQNSHHVSMVYQVESRFEQCACIEEVYVIPQSLVRFEQLCLIVVPKKTWILKHHPGMPNNTLFRAVIFDEICRFAARNLLPMPKHAIIIKDSGFQTLRTVNSMWPNMKSISCLEGFFSPEWPRVIDSKLELIAFPDGYIEPEGLERIYADSELVSQCFIHFQRSILLAIVVPDEQALFVKNKQMYRLSGNFWRLCRHHQIKQLILNAMRSTAIKNNLVNFEIVQDIYISPDRFSVHNNLLTFAQKKNRPNLKARFQSHIDKMIVKIVSNQ